MISLVFAFKVMFFIRLGRKMCLTLVDLGGVPGACPPWDPILSFSHTFSPKSAHVGGPHPPLMGAHPPMGNPGSATV